MANRILPRSVGLLAAVLALASLSACISKPAPVTHFYVLNPTAQANAASAHEKSVSVLIEEVTLPDYLERGQIVSRETANRLLLSDFEQWGGSLRKDIGRILATNLGRLLSTPHILVPPIGPYDRVDYRVNVLVLGFESGPDDQARLQARWTVRDGGNGKALGGQLSELSRPLPVDADMDQRVATLAALVGDLSQVIAESIGKAR
ncbi:MAG: PqiC family protein [Gammaproteobacteria bacterium]